MKISGSCTINLVAEERAFLVNAFKQIKTKNELEERIVQRTIARILRKNIHRFPLYPDKECPLCERTFKAKVFDSHFFRCKQKNNEPSYRVDPEILERIKHESIRN